MITLRNLSLNLTLAALACGMTLCAQQAVVSHDKSCQVTVPSGWEVNAMFGIGNSPDKKLSISVSSPRYGSFDSLKQSAQMAYANNKVAKDTATEFELEGEENSGKPHVYRAIPASGGKFCIADLMYESGTEAEAWAILRTVKPVK